jgi:aminopeptidase N
MKKLASIFLGILLSSSIQFAYSQNVLENKYDVKQYILDLQISESSAVISGNVTVKAVATVAVDTFAIELIKTLVANQTYMVVDSVFINGELKSFQHQNHLIFIPLTASIPQNELFSVQIYYHGKAGSNSATNYDGILYKSYSGTRQSFSSGEPFGAKIWFPVKQILTDKADSVTFYITTDSTNISGSNGLLESKTILPNGKCKYKWVSHYPIAYYLISFVVGGPYEERTFYTPLPNQDSVLMQNFLIPSSSYYPKHLVALEKANQLMYLYSEKYGIYPFKNEKFGNCVTGEDWGGMEHQTLCTMGYLLLDTTITDLSGIFYCWGTAHEFAHHWFGDYVTCATWRDIWLNEGMGTYVEYVAIQNLESQARADLWMNAINSYIKTSPGGSVYVPLSASSNYSRIFDGRLSYCKGASAMHMLRYEINNDSIFFTALRNYLNAFAYSNATTEDFKQSVVSTTSTNFDDFFNQWIYGEGYPIFHLNWSQANDTLTVLSNQTTSAVITPLFKTHFDLKINFTTGDTTIRLFQGANNEVYKLCFSDTVTSITFDPKGWLLQSNDFDLGITENSTNSSFDVFPNPAKDKITLTLKEGNKIKNAKISVFNIQGQLMMQQQAMEEKTEIDISRLAKGNYYIQLTAGDQKEVKKFVKD